LRLAEGREMSRRRMKTASVRTRCTCLFAGVDVSARRGLDVAVLDDRLRVILLENLPDAAALVRVAASLPAALVAVDASQAPSRGLMADESYRIHLDPPPPPGRYRGFRVCEYEVRRRGLAIYPTPRDPATAPGWMRVGFALFRALSERYDLPRGRDDPDAGLLEVYPALTFRCLSQGRVLAKKQSLAGRRQRAGMLEALRVTWARGEDGSGRSDVRVPCHDELDAIAAAYTAYLYSRGVFTWLGDPEEGLLLAPARRF